MNQLKKFLCLVLAAVSVLSISACSSQKASSEAQAVPTNLSIPEQKSREKMQGDVFVSPVGDDKNDGTEKNPVKTIQKALSLSRALNKSQKVIALASGEYNISAVQLAQEDNGTIFYADGEVIFNGGVTLDPADFEQYRNNIKMLDLKKYGVTKEQIGDVKAFGQYHTAEKYDEAGSLYCELFCDGQRMTLARYPNTGENLKTGKILDNGDSKEIYTKDGTQQNPEWADMKNPHGGTFAADKALTDRMRT